MNNQFSSLGNIEAYLFIDRNRNNDNIFIDFIKSMNEYFKQMTFNPWDFNARKEYHFIDIGAILQNDNHTQIEFQFKGTNIFIEFSNKYIINNISQNIIDMDNIDYGLFYGEKLLEMDANILVGFELEIADSDLYLKATEDVSLYPINYLQIGKSIKRVMYRGNNKDKYAEILLNNFSDNLINIFRPTP